jgi:hypothetical protein
VEQDELLCQATFIENPYGDRHTQASINERIVRPEEHENLLAAARAAHMEIEPGKPFDLSGIRGMEFVAREQKPATAGAPRKAIYLVSLETPKGYTHLRCSTRDEDFATALPQFRAIRDTIRPPR